MYCACTGWTRARQRRLWQAAVGARARLGKGMNTRAAAGTGGSGVAHARMQGARALEGKMQGRAGGKK